MHDLTSAAGADSAADHVGRLSSPLLATLDEVLCARSVRAAYQPLVDLDSGHVVGFEALARGPAGSRLERPDQLFSAAREAGRVTELDLLCRHVAIEGARTAGMEAPYRLFVNVEPDALDDWDPEQHQKAGSLTVIVELTERSLAARPAQLLRAVERVRALGWGIAVDDVGAEPASLALLPLLRPDVVKLDLRLVQDRPTAYIAAVMNAVNAEAERSGSLVLAEGIETAEHLQIARAMGATVGQGWYLGMPKPLPKPLPPFSGRPVPVDASRRQQSETSAFGLASGLRTPRHALKPLLIEISKHLEAQACNAGEAVVVLSAFEEARFFSPATRRRYTALVGEAGFVGVLGAGMSATPLPGVRGGHLHQDDPMRLEWDVAVVGPHFAATLVARDLGDAGPEDQRRFEFVLSHDRELTVSVANALMSRIAPEGRP